jgi:hypothetical protein
MLAGKRKMRYKRRGILSFLVFGDMTKSDSIVNSKRVLVLTGDHTGHTARTEGDIK